MFVVLWVSITFTLLLLAPLVQIDTCVLTQHLYSIQDWMISMGETDCETCDDVLCFYIYIYVCMCVCVSKPNTINHVGTRIDCVIEIDMKTNH